MIPKEDAAQMIVDVIAVMIIKVATNTTTEIDYKKQEISELVIKKLNNIL